MERAYCGLPGTGQGCAGHRTMAGGSGCVIGGLVIVTGATWASVPVIADGRSTLKDDTALSGLSGAENEATHAKIKKAMIRRYNNVSHLEIIGVPFQSAVARLMVIPDCHNTVRTARQLPVRGVLGGNFQGTGPASPYKTSRARLHS